jgi:hypothetical protein
MNWVTLLKAPQAIEQLLCPFVSGIAAGSDLAKH